MARLPFDGTFPVSQWWGEHPEWYSRFGLPGHNGIDFACPVYTPLRAPADGEVWEAQYDGAGFGWYVKLRTPAGEDWLLGHMAHPCWAVPGTWVAEGAYLGCSGNSGYSSGPHTHLGYRPNGADHSGPWQGWSDPAPLLSLTR